MNSFKSGLVGACMMGMALLAANSIAQDADDEIETLGEQEQEIPAMPRIAGPITIIQPAALVFAGFDDNGDYLVNRDEALAGAKTAFKRADKDNSGKLTLFELEDWRAAALGSLDALPGNLNFDTDYDNQVQKIEFEGAVMNLFERHDADENGALKMAELMTIIEVPRRKEPQKQRLSDQECYAQIQRNRGRY